MAKIDPERAELSADHRAFACPGLYRIVAAKDGGICRIRVPLGVLTAEQARAIAAVAGKYGNGIVELTNRANLQIRGIAATLQEMPISELEQVGLGTGERWADDTRNVLVNPSAGSDPADVIDVGPIAAAVLERLAHDSAFAVLSPKFAVQIDGGGAMSVADHPHDIWLLAVATDDLGPMFKIGLGGAIEYGDDGTSTRLVGPQECAEIVIALIAEFVETGVQKHGFTRVRQLLDTMSRDDVWRRLELRLGRPLRKISPGGVRSHAVAVTQPPLGTIAQADVNLRSAGGAPVLGRVSAADLESIAAVADVFGRGVLRLTPWRSFLVPDVDRRSAADAVRALTLAGLVCGADNPMGRLVACAGSSGCVSGKSDVKEDALKLARLLGSSADRTSVHVSGCSKSCAVPGTADVTLVGVAAGIYDVYRRAPSAETRFGIRLAEGVDLDRALAFMGGSRG